MEHANLQILIAIVVVTFLILYCIFSARAGRKMHIRRIPGLSEIDEAVGRATEMGRPALFHPGTGQIQDIGTLSALGVLRHVAGECARMGTRLIVTTALPVIVPIAEDIVKQAYESHGRGELFRAEDIRFLAAQGDQLALATANLMEREQTASHFFFGLYDYTSLLLTEPGQRTGAMQIAGTDQYFQIPFFITSCDYTVIGEELYAASAYLTKESTMLGSLVGQDWGKILIISIILLGAIAVTLGYGDLATKIVGEYK
jgi:hypothetical protein